MEESNETILIVEDEKNLNAMIRDYLRSLGYAAESAHDGPEALRILHDRPADLVLLDLMLPGLDGMEVARRIRSRSGVPIIMLTARAEEADKLIGLEIGADDYVTKPFSMRELAARIRAVLRRSGHGRSSGDPDPGAGTPGGGVVSHLDLRLDPEKRTLTRSGEPVHLTSFQFDILSHMLRNPGRVFTRMDLLSAAGGDAYEGYERTVDVHIKNIRKALEPDPSRLRYIQTVWGVGYRMAEREEGGS